jgi:3-phosphoshikimate 1-carboxyvinyltransferase
MAAVTRLRVPGDKSISHRVLLLGALATGRSRLRGVLPAGDPRATGRVLRALGSAIPELAGDELVISGGGLHHWRPPAGVLDCGNSGTTARLLLGALAGVPITARLDGDASLRTRPMRRVTEPLGRMGARVEHAAAGERLPLTIRGGGLVPIEHASPVASAQVKSALLLAGLTGGVSVAVREPHLSRDHTERLLVAMGVPLDRTIAADGARVACEPVDRLEPLDVNVPGDFSSAAFLLAWALLAARPLRIDGVGMNPTRTGLLGVLERMGARVQLEDRRASGGEPVADLVIEPAELRGTTITGDEIAALIDELPILAALATRAGGETRVEGAGELRVKESDRIAAIVANVRAIGGEADELRDGFVIAGSPKPLRGSVATRHDHRIAMAFGVLGAAPGNAIAIDDPGVADISFPGFWALLASLGARVPAG